ncbi:MAG: hypothetical protein M3016_07535 [Actinomycetota bacterium]|nr:hypothetical protein [Actinomycetota bacterium]
MSYGQKIRLDSKVAALAARQHGNVTRPQLLRAGLGSDAINYRCRHKQLFRVHAGVYAVGRPPATPLERAAAAVLACGPGAALSHRSALTLWGFASEWDFPLHVISGDRKERPQIVTHKAPGLTRSDLRTQLGIRATSPARTFLDCASDLAAGQLSRRVADARRAGLLHLDAIADVVTRFPYHPAHAKLLAVIQEAGAPTRSEFEDAFLLFCALYGLPVPLINTRVAGHEVDALFPRERVIVELDGWEFHRGRHAFESDRDRDADTLAAGLVTVRITWGRMIGRPGPEARRLHTILEQRR